MAATPAGDTMAAVCPTYQTMRRNLPYDTSNAHRERAALTHALHCPTCQPIADQHRQNQAELIAQLTAETDAELRQAAIPTLHAANHLIQRQGFYPHYLWDTRQAHRGTPIEECRLDIAGALAVTLYGLPTYAATPRVLAIEKLIVDRIDVPSLPAWYTLARPRTSDAVALLRRISLELTGARP